MPSKRLRGFRLGSASPEGHSCIEEPMAGTCGESGSGWLLVARPRCFSGESHLAAQQGASPNAPVVERVLGPTRDVPSTGPRLEPGNGQLPCSKQVQSISSSSASPRSTPGFRISRPFGREAGAELPFPPPLLCFHLRLRLLRHQSLFLFLIPPLAVAEEKGSQRDIPARHSFAFTSLLTLIHHSSSQVDCRRRVRSHVVHSSSRRRSTTTLYRALRTDIARLRPTSSTRNHLAAVRLLAASRPKAPFCLRRLPCATCDLRPSGPRKPESDARTFVDLSREPSQPPAS